MTRLYFPDTPKSEYALGLRRKFNAPSLTMVSGYDTLSDGYESDQVTVPASITGLVSERRARYVRVEDAKPNSILNQLLSFSYSATEMTVIDVIASPRIRRFVMIGENVALSSVLPQLRRAFAESQAQSGGIEMRGNPGDARSLFSRLSAILRLRSTMAKKAAEIIANEDKGRILWGKPVKPTQAGRIATLQSYLTQLKKDLESTA